MSKSIYNRAEDLNGDQTYEKRKLEEGSKCAAERGTVQSDNTASRDLHDRSDNESDSVREISVVFHMLPARLNQGLVKVLLAGMSGGLGVFMLAEVSNTPGLALNLVIVGGIGITVAVILLALAYRELVGRLTVNEKGIFLDPHLSGFHLTWKEVGSWQITDENELPPQLQQLRLWRHGTTIPIVLDTSWLSVEARGALRQVLRKVATKDRFR